MKNFGTSIWKNVQSEIFRLDTVQNGISKLREITANPKILQDILRGSAPATTATISYQLKPTFVKTFATSGLPFLTYYEFNDLTGWCRDIYFAPDHVDGYAEDIGQQYTVWTHEATSMYRRHIFLDTLAQDITVSFGIPSLATASWFPLRIKLFDRDGLYFQNDQKLVVDRISDGRPMLTSWKKIPQLQTSLIRLHARTSQDG